MEKYFPFFQERFFMLSVITPGRSMSGRIFRLVLLAGISISGPVSLAAQQTDLDHAPSAVLDAAPAATPASEVDAQATTASVQSSGANTPATQNQPPQNAADNSGDKQTKRILGIVPNFRAVSADEKLPPESVKEKFIDATQDSFDYSSIFFPLVIAGYNQARNSTPEFHQGAAGFARYFWHSAVDQTSENYMVEFIFPTVTHEDARYYTLGHGGFLKRTGYALSRAVITRTDSGKEVFNFSEVVGAGAAAGLSNLYYPPASRTLGNTGSQWGLDVGIDAGVFVFREFWPDINRHVFHNKYNDTPAKQ
jgi:hypothetical protein